MQKLLVGNKLQFRGDANNTDNIIGNFSKKKMVIYDDFTGIALDAGRWVFAGNNGGTEAITAAQGGTVTLTTGATDDDRSLLATPLIFKCAQNPIIEARLKVSALTTIGINFGFNDATTEGDNALAMEITAAAIVNGKNTDGAMFIYDTDATTDVLYYGATKNDTEGTPTKVASNAILFCGTGGLSGGSPVYLNPGSTTITSNKTGTYYIDLPPGCSGTATQSTATLSGSPVTLNAGRNTLTVSAVGTVTILFGQIPLTTFNTYRVALNAAGDAFFYINGKAVGTKPACITTTAALCGFMGVIARTTSARVLTVDYFKAWQDRN